MNSVSFAHEPFFSCEGISQFILVSWHFGVQKSLAYIAY